MTQRSATILAASAVSYGVCAGFSIGQALGAGPFVLREVAFDLAVPGMATLTFVLLSFAIRSLVPDAPMRFPLPATLPAVHVALMVAWASLLGTMRNSVVALPEALVAATSWERPDRWIPVFAVQFAALAASTLASRRARR